MTLGGAIQDPAGRQAAAVTGFLLPFGGRALLAVASAQRRIHTYRKGLCSLRHTGQRNVFTKISFPYVPTLNSATSSVFGGEKKQQTATECAQTLSTQKHSLFMWHILVISLKMVSVFQWPSGNLTTFPSASYRQEESILGRTGSSSAPYSNCTTFPTTRSRVIKVLNQNCSLENPKCFLHITHPGSYPVLPMKCIKLIAPNGKFFTVLHVSTAGTLNSCTSKLTKSQHDY